jgi:hypothetical protein
MSSQEIRQTAPPSQAISDEQLKSTLAAMLGRGLMERLTLNPIIVEHGVYSREQIIEAFGISPNTLNDWQNDGLPVLRRGAKENRYLGRDVIEFTRVAPGLHQKPATGKRPKKNKT